MGRASVWGEVETAGTGPFVAAPASPSSKDVPNAGDHGSSNSIATMSAADSAALGPAR